MEILVGCCGFPRKKESYYKDFKLVEIQKTFYKLPRVETVKKWRESAPLDFVFTLKAPQLITHPSSSPTYFKAGIKIKEEDKDKYGFFRHTKEVFEAWEETKRIAEALKAEIILFQCPPSFKEEKENVENMLSFFSSISYSDIILAWEPRGRWSEQTIQKLCADLDLVHCVDPFSNKQLYGEISYFRLHGIGTIKYKYKDEDLEYLKGVCDKKREEGKKAIYCLFNNIYMYEDAKRFKEICHQALET
ncbi:MAG: DUF72 domain-containing protein [Candidatus Methanospirareceae archaeon]